MDWYVKYIISFDFWIEVFKGGPHQSGARPGGNSVVREPRMAWGGRRGHELSPTTRARGRHEESVWTLGR
jgi:hypothetical protein